MVNKQSENTGNSKKQNPDEEKQVTAREKRKTFKLTEEKIKTAMEQITGNLIPIDNTGTSTDESVRQNYTNDAVDSLQTETTHSTMSKRISGKQRKESLEEYRTTFLTVPKLEDRKPVFISREIRDQLDEITRKLGGRKMSVSGFIENLVRHHLDLYREDIESWKKL